MKFTVQGRIESRNKLDGWHWSRRAEYAKQWHWRVVVRMGRRNWPEAKRSVILTVYRNRLLDSDNLSGGCKAIRDALVKAGFLVDDSPKWCEFTYNQATCPKGAERVDVEIQQ